MAQSPIQTAITQICQEKNISEEEVLHAIELALAAAYRKDFGNKLQNIVAEFDLKTGGVKVVDVKTVVEDMPEEELESDSDETADDKEPKKVKEEIGENKKDEKSFTMEDGEEGEEEEVRKFNPKTEIQISEAKELDKKYKIGDEIVTSLEVPGEFGRMAAQTAKQVIIQRIREIERENVFTEYKDLEGQVVNGSVQRREGRNVLVDLERATALMPTEEQIVGERYSVGNRMKFYLMSVDQTGRGPQLTVSRAHSEIVRKIFELEIPEVANGAIEIKAIAREAGYRSKVAIFSTDDSIDPIGSCVGQRGARIQTIISELSGEKIDIILWDEDPIKFITNALSPAKILSVELKDQKSPPSQGGASADEADEGVAGDADEEEKAQAEKIAIVTVKEDQLSLAIGRSGQNVRLASKLSGWKIDIVPEAGEPAQAEGGAGKEEDDSAEDEAGEEKEDKKDKEVDEKKKKKVDKKDREVEEKTEELETPAEEETDDEVKEDQKEEAEESEEKK